MDSNTPRQSEENKRDEAVARRLGSVLERASESGRLNCPDSESIAAYVDRSLSAEEIAQCEGHFASCARCRETLALLVASADSTAAELPTRESARLSVTVPVSGKRTPRVAATVRERRKWRTRWLAPALGAAAVLLIWLTLRPPWGGGSKDTLVAQAPRTELPQVPRLPVLNQTAPAPAERSSPREDAISSSRTNQLPAAKQQVPITSAKQPSKPGTADNFLSAVNEPAEDANVSAVHDEKEKGVTTGHAQRQGFQAAAGPAPLPAAAPPAPVSSAGGAIPNAEAPRSTSQSVVVTQAAPAIQAQAKAQSGTAAAGDLSVTDLPSSERAYLRLAPPNATGAFAVQMKSPSAGVAWRAGVGGTIQRSTDSGRTWAAETSPIRQDWLAGVALSDQVAWLVGRKGSIARTADGENWTQVLPPGPAGMPDWVGVTATDAKNATITASDKRQYVTRDGGKAWQPQ